MTSPPRARIDEQSGRPCLLFGRTPVGNLPRKFAGMLHVAVLGPLHLGARAAAVLRVRARLQIADGVYPAAGDVERRQRSASAAPSRDMALAIGAHAVKPTAYGGLGAAGFFDQV